MNLGHSVTRQARYSANDAEQLGRWLVVTGGMSGNGPSVWTGRALQAESDDLEVMGLALLYPALERNV